MPFWGNGAIKALGFAKGQPVRIVCNLEQPGCNPTVIAEIRKLGIKVKTHPRLHAKLYVTPALAIVGSSNVSTNGMTAEGAAAKGWIEANVASPNPAFITAVQDLFAEIWSSPESKRVTDAVIKRALANRPPPFARPFRATTLLAACRENPAAFSSVFVVPYDDDLSIEAKKHLNAIREEALPPRPGISWSDFRRAEGYQFGDIPQGAWLLGLDCRSSLGPKYVGCGQATGLQFPIRGQTSLDVTLPGVITVEGRRFPVGKVEKTALVSVAAQLLQKGGLIPLPKVVKLIDRLLARAELLAKE